MSDQILNFLFDSPLLQSIATNFALPLRIYVDGEKKVESQICHSKKFFDSISQEIIKERLTKATAVAQRYLEDSDESYVWKVDFQGRVISFYLIVPQMKIKNDPIIQELSERCGS